MSSLPSSCNNHPNSSAPRKLVRHNYHDYSNASAGTNPVYVTRGGVTTLFPLKLYNMLSCTTDPTDERIFELGGREYSLSSIVGWQPHGRAFKVHDVPLFKECVLPEFFGMKYSSFLRQLNLYGFTRLSAGVDKGAYYHELFLQNRDFLVCRIQRTKVKGSGTRAAANPDEEPNFYAMIPMRDVPTPSPSSSPSPEQDHLPNVNASLNINADKVESSSSTHDPLPLMPSSGVRRLVSNEVTDASEGATFNEINFGLEAFNLSDLSDETNDDDDLNMDILKDILSDDDDAEDDVVTQIFKEVQSKDEQLQESAASAPEPLPTRPTFQSEPPKLDADEIDFLHSLFGVCAATSSPANTTSARAHDKTTPSTVAEAMGKAATPKLAQPQVDTVNTQAEYRRTVNDATGAHYGNDGYRRKYQRTVSARSA